MKCAKCLSENPEGAKVCGACGAVQFAGGGPPPLPSQPGAIHQPLQKKGWATAALVCGLLSVISLGVLFPVGVVVGVIAAVKTRKNPEIHGGRGMVVAGLIVSSLSAALLLFIVMIAVLIPNFVESRPSVQEDYAVAGLKDIAVGAARYAGEIGGGRYPQSITDLSSAGLVDSMIFEPDFPYAFRYALRTGPYGPGYSAVAEPKRKDTGLHWFYIDETGIVRSSDSADVGPNSPRLEESE